MKLYTLLKIFYNRILTFDCKRFFFIQCIVIIFLLSNNHTQLYAQNSTIQTVPWQSNLQELTLLFAGDLMQHQAQIEAAKSNETFDYTHSFQFIKEEIRKADLAIGNLEITLGGKPYKGYPAFSAPDEFIYSIQDAGFDILTTANNHCLDRGKNGGKRTIQILDSIGIFRLGTYHDSIDRKKNYPLIINIKNFRIAFLAYTYATNGIKASLPFCVNYIHKAQITKDIQEAKQHQPDAIIALMHWGEEYQSLPSKEQIDCADWLFEQGVTHIIGSHPHVVQPIEIRTDSISLKENVLVYSLGNFISNMSAPKTDGGIMMKIVLKKEAEKTVLKDYNYSLIWTERPLFNKEKDFYVLPVSRLDSISNISQAKFKQFIQSTRSFFEKHNKAVYESSF